MGKEKKDKKEKKEKKAKKEEADSDADSDASGKGSEKGNENLQYNEEETKEVIKGLQVFYEKNGEKTKMEDLFEEVRLQQLAKLFDHKTRLYIVLGTLCGDSMDAKKLGKVKGYVEDFIENAKMEAPDVLWAFGAYLDINADAA